MADKRKDVLKLVRAIPATVGIKDHAARRCVAALKEIVEQLLVETYGDPNEQVKTMTPTGIAELEEGENISIEKLAGRVRRISARDTGISAADAMALARQVTAEEAAGGIDVDGNNEYDQLEWDGTDTWRVCEAPHDPAAAIDTVGSAAEGNEAAESTTKTFSGTNGLAFYVQSRTAYYHGGDKKLYGYFRLLTFDGFGRLYSVGAETRVEVDATVLET